MELPPFTPVLAAGFIPPLITTLAGGFFFAWLFGLLTQRLGMSPIVGYLLAGVIIGPNTPGFVGDIQLAHQLAEVGVILLMFGVGLHFHWKDLYAVRGIAVPGAVGQSAAATLVGLLVFTALGMPVHASTVLGMAMAVASTVVLMRVLMDAHSLDTPQGHVAVGWLLVEDVFTVIILVLIPVLAAGTGEVAAGGEAAGPIWMTIGLALLKLLLLVVVVVLAGNRAIPWVLVQVARLRSSELFTLTVLVFSVAVATAAYVVFGASMALGAFLAGMVVAQSPVSHQAAADALPMRDAFAVLFFVSVGMIFDPAFIVEEPLMLLAALGIILLIKPLSALIIVALLGHSARTALTVAVGLAQIGEFSFIVSDVARREGLMPESGHNALVAAAILSIILNPLLFRALPKIEAWAKRRRWLWAFLSHRAERRLKQLESTAAPAATAPAPGAPRRAIVIGYGPVGRSVDRLLRDAGIETLIIDLNMDTVSELNAQGRPAIFGDASREAVLERAGVEHASYLVVALPHSAPRAAIVSNARAQNAALNIFVRAHYLQEHAQLEQAGASAAVFEEEEAAVALARLVLSHTGATREGLDDAVRDLRLRLILESAANLRTRTVRGMMVPWMRVQRLSQSDLLEEVLRKVARNRISAWPVVDATGAPVGYLRVRDLIAASRKEAEWTSLVRPLPRVSPDDVLETLLVRLKQTGASMAAVMLGDRPVGLITVEDILDQGLGRIDDTRARRPAPGLTEALHHGAVVLDLARRSADAVIAELAAAVPPGHVPSGVDVARLAVAREHEISTDIGCGVAVPHARCPGLDGPVVVFGRSAAGIPFSDPSHDLVRLLFLILTPADQPETQLHLLGRVATLVSEPVHRDQLLAAGSAAEVLQIVEHLEHQITAPGA